MIKSVAVRDIPPHEDGVTAKFNAQGYVATKKQTMKNIHFTSSVVGKYFIYKNDELLAVLFTNSKNLNADYRHDLQLKKNDVISFRVQNQDYAPADMYVSFEVV